MMCQLLWIGSNEQASMSNFTGLEATSGFHVEMYEIGGINSMSTFMDWKQRTSFHVELFVASSESFPSDSRLCCVASSESFPSDSRVCIESGAFDAGFHVEEMWIKCGLFPYVELPYVEECTFLNCSPLFRV
jgi:hypothetical protein